MPNLTKFSHHSLFNIQIYSFSPVHLIIEASRNAYEMVITHTPRCSSGKREVSREWNRSASATYCRSFILLIAPPLLIHYHT